MFYRTFLNQDELIRIAQRQRRDGLKLGPVEPSPVIREKLSHSLLFAARCAIRYAQAEKCQGREYGQLVLQAFRYREQARAHRRNGK